AETDADAGANFVAHQLRLRRYSMDRNIVSSARQAIRAGSIREITGYVGRAVRAVTKVIDGSRQRQVVSNFLICRDRSARRRHTQTRRRRIAAEHRMRPIDAGVEDRDVNTLTFVAVW